MKNPRVFLSFVWYCLRHRDLRFWQALSNWSGYVNILVSDECSVFGNQKDTYYWEGRRGDQP